MQGDTAFFYTALLHAHRTLVGVSVVLFIARAIGVAGQRAWPMTPVIRWSSVLIDTALMATGIALWVLMQHNPVHEPWLALKLFLLLVMHLKWYLQQTLQWMLLHLLLSYHKG